MASKVQTKYERTCFLVDELEARRKFTPDFGKLKQQKYHPVFIYGPNHLLSDNVCLGDAYSAQTMFIMRSIRAKHGNFPALCQAMVGQENIQARVYGSVYICSADDIMDLDYLEQNGEMHQRDARFFWLTDQSYSTKTGLGRPCIKAWVYIAKNDWIFSTSTESTIMTRKHSNYFQLSSYFEWDGKSDALEETQMSRMMAKWREQFPDYYR